MSLDFLRKSLFLFAALAAFFNVASAHAQQNNPFEVAAEGLTLSPPSFEMTLKPGEETAYTIQITNPTKNLIELYPSAGNFSASGDDGQPKYEIDTTAVESASSSSLASWISFYAPKVALLPEQIVNFQFRIKVPEDAEPGGHYGVVFLGTKPPEDKDKNAQVALSSMVGSLLLVRIPGDVREEANIEEFSAPWFFFAPPVDFTIFLRNTGNIHVRPQGDVSLIDWRGQNIHRLDINPKKGSILPQSRRKFDVTWTPDLSPFWKIPIGKFHATLTVAYGQSGKTLTQQIAFWVIPKWFIITISVLLALLVIFLVVFIIRRRRRKKRRNKNTPPPHFPGAPDERQMWTRRLPPSSADHPLKNMDPYQNQKPAAIAPAPLPPMPMYPPSSPETQTPRRSPSRPHGVPISFSQTPRKTVQQTPLTPAPERPTKPPHTWLDRISASNEALKENKKNMRF